MQAILEQRLAQCRQAREQKATEHAQLVAYTKEVIAQINALLGREAELAELIALVPAPPPAPSEPTP